MGLDFLFLWSNSVPYRPVLLPLDLGALCDIPIKSGGVTTQKILRNGD